jgi:hypothetical protein
MRNTYRKCSCDNSRCRSAHSSGACSNVASRNTTLLGIGDRLCSACFLRHEMRVSFVMRHMVPQDRIREMVAA